MIWASSGATREVWCVGAMDEGDAREMLGRHVQLPIVTCRPVRNTRKIARGELRQIAIGLEGAEPHQSSPQSASGAGL